MLDVEKAFDNVWHDGLVYKLCYINFPPHLIKIIRSYLQERSFRVSLNGYLSNAFLLPAGVAQGSLLGPMLYSIPPLGDDCVFFLSADDTTIAVKGRMPTEITNKLQRCLDAFASTWKIKINASKIQAVMCLHRQSDRLNPPSNCDHGWHKGRVAVRGTVPWTDVRRQITVQLACRQNSDQMLRPNQKPVSALLTKISPLDGP